MGERGSRKWFDDIGGEKGRFWFVRRERSVRGVWSVGVMLPRLVFCFHFH